MTLSCQRGQPGFVYLLGNQCMPTYYKIGKTRQPPHRRANDLSSTTSVPTPFHIVCYIETEDCHKEEQELHSFLDEFRVSSQREFFRFTDRQMPWVIGIFAHHPSRVAYADGEVESFADYQPENPWAGVIPGGVPTQCRFPPWDFEEATPRLRLVG